MKRLTSASLLALLALLGPARIAAADAPVTPWEPAAVVEGTPYHKLEELRSFYKLTPNSKSASKAAYTMGNADVTLELGPGTRELRIGGIALALSHPLQKDATGGWLISREDWLCLIDPILRPTYIAGREAVQTVVIDPGHGGHDEGETTPQLREAELTLQVALKLKAELEKLGYKVKLTREENLFVSNRQRVECANSAGAGAIFLSLHVNSGRSDFRGSAIYTLAPGTDARPGHARQAAHAALGYALQSALIARAGTVDAGCRRAHFSLLSSVTCPAVWVELGYTTHAQEGAILATPAYQETLAQALAQGVATYARVADPTAKIPVQALPQRTPVKQPVSTPAKPTTTKQTPPTTASSSGSSASRSTSTQSSRQTTRNTSSPRNKQQSTSTTRSSSNSSSAGSAKNTGSTKSQSSSSSNTRRQQPAATGRTRR